MSGQGGISIMNAEKEKIIEKITVVFMLAYGFHYFGYFIRVRYFNWLSSMAFDAGFAHAMRYLGHVFFFGSMMLYAWGVKKDRHYFFSFLKERSADKLKYGVLGLLFGAFLISVCVLGASLNGDIVIRGSAGGNLGVLLFAVFCVFFQSMVEEIQDRAFVFGKMYEEGVPFLPAMAVSAFFFSYLHAANPGYGILPFINLLTSGAMYVLSYHYFGSLWFAITAHTAWNYMQDFLFGLPNSGKPAAVSFMSTTVNGSSFFYDEKFGIEGSWMSIMIHILACLFLILIGRYLQRKRELQKGQGV